MGRLDSVEVPYATPDPALPAPWRFRPRWRWLPSVVLSLTALAAGDAVVYAKGVSFFFDHVSACMILLPVAAVAVPLALKPRGRRLLGGMALGLVLVLSWWALIQVVGWTSYPAAWGSAAAAAVLAWHMTRERWWQSVLWSIGAGLAVGLGVDALADVASFGWRSPLVQLRGGHIESWVVPERYAAVAAVWLAVAWLDPRGWPRRVPGLSAVGIILMVATIGGGALFLYGGGNRLWAEYVLTHPGFADKMMAYRFLTLKGVTDEWLLDALARSDWRPDSPDAAWQKEVVRRLAENATTRRAVARLLARHPAPAVVEAAGNALAGSGLEEMLPALLRVELFNRPSGHLQTRLAGEWPVPQTAWIYFVSDVRDPAPEKPADAGLSESAARAIARHLRLSERELPPRTDLAAWTALLRTNARGPSPLVSADTAADLDRVVTAFATLLEGCQKLARRRAERAGSAIADSFLPFDRAEAGCYRVDMIDCGLNPEILADGARATWGVEPPRLDVTELSELEGEVKAFRARADLPLPFPPANAPAGVRAKAVVEGKVPLDL
jgi:hypothetical protein